MKKLILMCSLILNSIYAQEIILGSSLPLTGPAQNLGIELKTGYDVYFNQLNAKGGINGIKIKVNAKDDQYEPRNTSINSTDFIEREKVFSLFGYVGTPTGQVAIPIIDKYNVPLFGLFTGAGIFRNPVNKNIFNIRASYGEEVEKLMEYFVDKNGFKKISLMVQSDAFGGAVKDASIKALTKRGLTIYSEGSYVRNTTDVQGGFVTIENAKPEVVIFVGTYKAMAEFAKLHKSKKSNSKLATISFIGTKGLIDESGANGDEIIISQVMPNPTTPTLPIVKNYQEAMKVFGNASFTYGSLEGYIYAHIFSKILEKSPVPITKEGFVQVATNFKGDIDGLKVDFSRGGNQALGEVYLTKISNGKILNIE